MRRGARTWPGSGWSRTGAGATPRAPSPGSTPGATTACWWPPWRRPWGAPCSWPAWKSGSPAGGRRSPSPATSSQDGTVHPQGYRHLERFSLERGVPTWRYRRRRGPAPEADLDAPRAQRHLRPLHPGCGRPRAGARWPCCPCAPTATSTRRRRAARTGASACERHAGGLTVQAFAGATPYHLLVDAPAGAGLELRHSGGRPGWWWRFLHRGGAGAGPGRASRTSTASATVGCELAPGESLLLTASHRSGGRTGQAPALGGRQLPTDPRAGTEADALVARARGGPRGSSSSPARSRISPDGGPGAQTVIAGYHWFGDWGRDTMIALPGLAAATGRWEEAGDILRAFARYVDQGMLPNRFPDSGAPLTEADYNTVGRHPVVLPGGGRRSTAPWGAGWSSPCCRCWPRSWTGTSGAPATGSGSTPRTGCCASDNGQLTWMDAQIGDWIVTPRAGKPVEVAALWHHALGLMDGWCRAQRAGRPRPPTTPRCASGPASGFAARFWYAGGGYLYDVVDGPRGRTTPACAPTRSSPPPCRTAR